MYEDVLRGKWKEIKGGIKEKWGHWGGCWPPATRRPCDGAFGARGDRSWRASGHSGCSSGGGSSGGPVFFPRGIPPFPVVAWLRPAASRSPVRRDL